MRTTRSLVTALALSLPLAACASLSGSSGAQNDASMSAIMNVAQKVSKCEYGAMIVTNGSFYDAVLYSNANGGRIGEVTGLSRDQVLCFRRTDMDQSSQRLDFSIRLRAINTSGYGTLEGGGGHVWTVSISESGPSVLLISAMPDRRFVTREDIKRNATPPDSSSN